MEIKAECPECQGKTVMFKGRGLYLEYKVCSRWEEEGHLTRDEILDEIKERRHENAPPSGRWA